jgi:RNA polymerase sigma-70 factor (ECF subfamily)
VCVHSAFGPPDRAPMNSAMATIGFAGWLAAAQFGDETGFGMLWRELNPAVLRYLQVAASDAAEDLASETWLQVVRGLKEFRGDEAGFRSWVFTIARHKVHDWHRQQGRRVAAHLDDAAASALRAADDTEEAALETLGTDAALRLIRALPPDQAELLLLRLVAGLEVAEVARILHKSPGAVRVGTHRALQRLRALVTSEPAMVTL